MTSERIDFTESYNLLMKLSTSSTPEDNLLLRRFIDKVSDSTKFCTKMKDHFRGIKLSRNSGESIYAPIINREVIELHPGLILTPVGNYSWKLTLPDGTVIDRLSSQLARRILLDINIAFSIKNSRDKDLEMQA